MEHSVEFSKETITYQYPRSVLYTHNSSGLRYSSCE